MTAMKRKTIALQVMLLFNSMYLIAQEWTYYKDFPVNVSPVDVVSNNAGTLFMWSSDNRMFYKPLNGDWAEMQDNGSGPISPSSISVDKTSNRFYVGDQFTGGIYYTADYGLNWQQSFFSTNPVSGLHEPIVELSNISNPNLFFGGSFDNFTPLIVRYTNQGQSGQIIEFDPNDNLANTPAELHYTANGKLLIGTNAGGIWIGENNGTLYTQSALNQHQVYRFTERPDGRVYALGYDSGSDLPFLVYSDNYMNWTSMPLPNNTDRYTTLYFDNNSQNLWLGSETGIYKTQAGAWTNASYNNAQQFLIRILGDNNTGLYNFSNEAVAQKLNAAGNGWSNVNNGLTGTVTKVIFGTGDKLFASSYTTNNISTAANATANWANTYLGGQTSGVRNMYIAANGNIYADTGFKVKKSADNGLTYTDITPANLPNFISRFYVGEAGGLFLVKSNETDKLYSSFDQGANWSLLHTFPSVFPFIADQIGSVAQDGNGVIYVTMESIETGSGTYKIYYSTNNGSTWNEKIFQDDQNPSLPFSGFSKDTETFFFIGSRLFRFNYANTNNEFTEILPPDGLIGFGNRLWIDGLGNYYMYDSGLFKSGNQGEDWISLGSPAQVNVPIVDDVFFDSNNRAYVVATQTVLPEQRGIYYVTETLGSENPVPGDVIGVFPNPVQDQLFFETGQQIEEVLVYDLLGRSVTAKKSTRDSIDTAHLPTGVYLIKATDLNGKAFVAKFVKK